MTVTVLHNQSILDISIQYTGIVENCFAIAIYNDLSVSDFLVPGSSLEIPEDLELNNDVINYFLIEQLQPATGMTEKEAGEIPTLKGIGYMIVENTFKLI
jgi:hypothetical protein